MNNQRLVREGRDTGIHILLTQQCSTLYQSNIINIILYPLQICVCSLKACCYTFMQISSFLFLFSTLFLKIMHMDAETRLLVIVKQMARRKYSNEILNWKYSNHVFDEYSTTLCLQYTHKINLSALYIRLLLFETFKSGTISIEGYGIYRDVWRVFFTSFMMS